MKKVLLLILLGIPFLTFSIVSWSNENAQIGKNQDILFMKVKSTKTYYMKTDDQSAIPASNRGTTIAVKKEIIHTTTILDEKGTPIHTTKWGTEGKHVKLISFIPAAIHQDVPKAEITPNPSQEDGLNVTVHDNPATNSAQPAPNATPGMPTQPAATLEPTLPASILGPQ